jgi:hypothetical protein
VDEGVDPLDQLNPYLDLIWYEYALRREAGLEPQEAVQFSFRRVLHSEGLHPVLAIIAGYGVGEPADKVMAELLLENMIDLAEGAWQEFQQIPDWRPGTVGMGW